MVPGRGRYDGVLNEKRCCEVVVVYAAFCGGFFM